MHGECMVLAMTLATRHDMETVAVHDGTWRDIPRHVAVMTPQGTYVDARGADMDLSTFLSEWDETAYVSPISHDRMHRIWGYRIADWTAPDENLAILGLDQRSLAAERPEMRPTIAGLQASNG